MTRLSGHKLPEQRPERDPPRLSKFLPHRCLSKSSNLLVV
jgi:hypothetical protein